MCVGGSGNDMMSEIDLKKPQNKNKRQIQQYWSYLE